MGPAYASIFQLSKQKQQFRTFSYWNLSRETDAFAAFDNERVAPIERAKAERRTFRFYCDREPRERLPLDATSPSLSNLWIAGKHEHGGATLSAKRWNDDVSSVAE